jgi:hypothetical protein
MLFCSEINPIVTNGETTQGTTFNVCHIMINSRLFQNIIYALHCFYKTTLHSSCSSDVGLHIGSSNLLNCVNKASSINKAVCIDSVWWLRGLYGGRSEINISTFQRELGAGRTPPNF